jgi:hypothetical protein
VVTGYIDKNIRVKNSGEVAAAGFILNLKEAGPDAQFKILGHDCAEILEIQKSCEVKARFSPQADGKHKNLLVASFKNGRGNDAGPHAEFTLSGIAKKPALLVFSENKIDFGTALLGNETDGVVSLHNKGNTEATGVGTAIEGGVYGWKGGGFPGDGGDCSDKIAPGDSCKLALSYRASKKEASEGVLNVTFMDGAHDTKVSAVLIGMAILPGIAEADTQSFSFGARVVGSRNTGNIFVRNTGDAPIDWLVDDMEISGDFSFSGGKFPGAGGSCSGKLMPGGRCAMEVSFNPDSEQNFQGSLLLSYRDGVKDKSQIKIPMEAVSHDPAVIAGSGIHDFDKIFVGDHKQIVLELRNDGHTEGLIKFFSSDPDVFYFDEGCPKKLAPEEKCSLNVTFHPQKARVYEASVVVRYFDGLMKKETEFHYKGEARRVARVTLGRSSLDFGTVIPGARKSKLVEIVNEGDVEATGLSMALPASEQGFDLSGGFPGKEGTCEKSIEPGARCVIDVTFVSSSAGPAEKTVELGYHNGREESTVPLLLHAMVEAPAQAPQRDIASEPPVIQPGDRR